MQLGSSKIEISPIILGTWQTGKNMWVGIEDSESIATIRTAIESGISTIDTAAIYGDGHSESIIGRSIKSYNRQDIQILTKVFPTDLAYSKVIESCHNSLRRLQTDYIDLLQIHWPAGTFDSPFVPIQDTLEAMVRLKDEGKIKAIGVSNFYWEQIDEANKYAPIESNQPPYSLFWRQSERFAIDYCKQQGISTLAYSSLAQGLLTGKFGAGHKFEPNDNRSKNRLMQPELYEKVQVAIKELREFATARGLSLVQVAIGYITSQANCAAIVGARSPQQAASNAKALGIHFSEDEISKLNTIADHVNRHLDNNPVLWQ